MVDGRLFEAGFRVEMAKVALPGMGKARGLIKRLSGAGSSSSMQGGRKGRDIGGQVAVRGPRDIGGMPAVAGPDGKLVLGFESVFTKVALPGMGKARKLLKGLRGVEPDSMPGVPSGRLDIDGLKGFASRSRSGPASKRPGFSDSSGLDDLLGRPPSSNGDGILGGLLVGGGAGASIAALAGANRRADTTQKSQGE